MTGRYQDFHPGSKRRHAIGSDTSAQGADFVAPRTPTQREHILSVIEECDCTPEQAVARLELRGVKIMLMSARPRCSELARLGLIKDSGRRGRGFGGSSAIIWTATSEEERAAFRAAAEQQEAA